MKLSKALLRTRFTALLVAVLLVSITLSDGLATPVSFEVSTTVIKVAVKPGESISLPLVVLNDEAPQRFSVDHAPLGFITIDKNAFELAAGQNAALDVSLVSQEAGVHVGSIVIRGEKEEVVLPVILEVESRVVPFDASTTISEASSQLNPGEFFTADVTMYNLRSLDPNVIAHFRIYKKDGTLLLSETQPLNIVGRSVRITKTFAIPLNAEEGDYVFAVLADYNGSIGISSAVFAVTNKKPAADFTVGFLELPIILVGLALIILLVVTLFVLNHYWNQKIIANAHYWNQRKLKPTPQPKPGNLVEVHKQVHKLEYQRKLLKEAYSRGYIKRASYLLGMRRIGKFISQKKKPL